MVRPMVCTSPPSSRSPSAKSSAMVPIVPMGAFPLQLLRIALETVCVTPGHCLRDFFGFFFDLALPQPRFVCKLSERARSVYKAAAGVVVAEASPPPPYWHRHRHRHPAMYRTMRA